MPGLDSAHGLSPALRQHALQRGEPLAKARRIGCVPSRSCAGMEAWTMMTKSHDRTKNAFAPDGINDGIFQKNKDWYV